MREDELEIGAGLDVGADVPGAMVDRVDEGEAEAHGVAEEVGVVRMMGVGPDPVDAERDAFPGFRVDGVLEVGLLAQRRGNVDRGEIFGDREVYRQRVVQGRGEDGVDDRVPACRRRGT